MENMEASEEILVKNVVRVFCEELHTTWDDADVFVLPWIADRKGDAEQAAENWVERHFVEMGYPKKVLVDVRLRDGQEYRFSVHPHVCLHLVFKDLDEEEAR